MRCSTDRLLRACDQDRFPFAAGYGIGLNRCDVSTCTVGALARVGAESAADIANPTKIADVAPTSGKP